MSKPGSGERPGGRNGPRGGGRTEEPREAPREELPPAPEVEARQAGAGASPSTGGGGTAVGGGGTAVQAAPPRPPQLGEHLSINALTRMSITDLGHIAKDLKIQGATGMRKQDLIFEVLKAQTEQ